MHRTNPEAGTVVAEGTVDRALLQPDQGARAGAQRRRAIARGGAAACLGASGFQFGEETERDDVAEGLVIRTDPAGDDAVSGRSTVITVFVSGGPNQVAIPPTVISDAVEVDAAALLESSRVRVQVARVRSRSTESSRPAS